MPDSKRNEGPQLTATDIDAGDLSRIGGIDATSDTPASTAPEVAPETGVVQVLEEVASVSKHAVVTGRVRISTRTETLAEVVRDTLAGQTVEVERVRLDRLLPIGEAAPQVRTEGEVTIIPIVEEVLVSEKRLRLKEELHVTRRVNARVFEERVPLRRQVAIVEHLDPEPTTGE